MTAILLSVSIALTIVVGILFGVARFMFRTPIEFDPYETPHGDMPYDGLASARYPQEPPVVEVRR